MNSLQRRNISVFDSFFEDFFRPNDLLKTDIVETDDTYQLLMDVPGMEKDDIKIMLKNGYLQISVFKERESKNETNKYLRKERMSQKQSRSFYVGDTVTEKDVNVSLKNGVLDIKVPKVGSKEKIEKYIEIR